MRLIVIGSSSSGNSYALQSDSGEILLIEAGVPFSEVRRCIGYKTSKVVGCIVSHAHQDHAKYAKGYLKAGIVVSSNKDVANKMLGVYTMYEGITFHFGDFSVTPFAVEHDVKNFGYLIHYPSFGTVFFATDCYNLHAYVKNCRCYLMECNYEDGHLRKAVMDGKTLASQADRIRLSHMSQAHAIEFLQKCEAEKSARQIVLIHGSSRHLNPDEAVSKFQQVIGIPTYYAMPNMELELM